MRLLLDPVAPAGGGASADPQADLVNLVLAALEKKPAASATTEKKPEEKPAVNVKPEDTPDIRTWLKQLEEKVTARDAETRVKTETDEKVKLRTQVAKLISDGDFKKVEEVLDKIDQSYKVKADEKDVKVKLIEGRLAQSAKKTALVEALTGVEFTSRAAAKDAIAKFDSLFDVKLDAQGAAQVFEKGTNKGVSEAIKARLESGEFDHFLKPSSRKGGIGNGNTSQASGNASAPKDIVEWISQGVANQQAAAKAAGLSTRSRFV